MSVPSLYVQQQGVGVATADNMNTWVQGGALASDLSSFVGVENMMVWTLGTSAPSDGGQGAFYWVGTGFYASDGVNVIVPSAALQGAWLRLPLTSSSSGGSLATAVFPNLAALQSAVLTSSTVAVTVLSYATPGDAPVRPMYSIAAPASPQPWQVRSNDGGYWQDSSGDFWVEWMGATAASADCSTALNNAFLAHLNLGSVLRGRGTKNCTNAVLWDFTGFTTRYCWADFNGAGQSTPSGFIIKFADGVAGVTNSYAAGAAFSLLWNGASPPQGVFYGMLKGLQITSGATGTDGLIAQIGRTDLTALMNQADFSIVAGNNSTGSSAAVMLVCGVYTSKTIYLQADGPGGQTPSSQVGLYALKLVQCPQCKMEIAVGGYGVGVILSTSITGLELSGEIADSYIGIQVADNTCEYNKWDGGGINDNTYAIDNHLPFASGNGTALRIGGSTVIGGNTNIFFNPNATDNTWGGCGVLLDVLGADFVNWTTPTGAVPATATWQPNLGAIPYQVSIFGASGSNTIDVNTRSWFDFTTGGYTVANVLPCVVTVGAGEKLQINYSGGSYTQTWKPLLTI